MLKWIPNEEKKIAAETAEKQLLAVMNQINKGLLSGTGYQKLLDLVFDSLDVVVPYDRIGIALVDGNENDESISMKWVRSKISVNHLNVAFSYRIEGSTLQKILKSGEPRIINDLIEYSSLNPNSISTQLILKDGIRSSLTCPLRSGDKNIGVVFFSSCKANTYRKQHVQTFLDVSDELSMIINHGRLSKHFEASKEQTRNLNMILHDLKSPLSVIQGFAEASLDEPWFDSIDADAKEVFQIFLRNSKYMFELLNELNEITELDENVEKNITDEVQLKDFCFEMTNFGKILADAKEIKFKSDTLCETPHIVGFDRHKIQRVLDNLFSNAIKYSRRGSEIKFKVHYTPERLSFSVRDYGLGIPAVELPKLFKAFGKTSVRPTEGETSTGLGLAISKKIVEQHNGTITVDSKDGEGSTFSFWIPLVPNFSFN